MSSFEIRFRVPYFMICEPLQCLGYELDHPGLQSHLGKRFSFLQIILIRSGVDPSCDLISNAALSRGKTIRA
jgi:hypothetical protein